MNQELFLIKKLKGLSCAVPVTVLIEILQNLAHKNFIRFINASVFRSWYSSKLKNLEANLAPDTMGSYINQWKMRLFDTNCFS